jgi:low affinity Fe/Cu permease
MRPPRSFCQSLSGGGSMRAKPILMLMSQERSFGERFGALATAVTRWTGSSWGFGTAVTVIVVWAITGPLFHFSDTWQLVINTGTTIVTFLMVFLIQRTQNKDGLAIQLKLNELVAAVENASNRLIDVEDLTDQELDVLRKHYQKLAEMEREDVRVAASHSLESATRRHVAKRHRKK